MFNVLIFEPYSAGHRMVFVRYLLRSMARRGDLRAILATGPESQEDPYIARLADEFGSLLSTVVVELPRETRGLLHFIHPRLSRQQAFLRILRSLVDRLTQETPVEYVFVPFLDDYCLFPMIWHTRPFRRIPWGGIVIRPRFHLRHVGADVPRRREDFFEKVAYRQLLRKTGLDRVFSIDPYLERYLRSDKVVSVPDPSDIRAIVPESTQFGLKSDAVVLLVYGFLDHRKAIDRLLVAMTDSRVPKTMTLLLAGEQSPELTSIMKGECARRLRADGRLVELNRHITDREEAAAFLRADVVWVYYPRNYCSSGALVRAGQSSRPVLATREGLVGLMVRDLNMGVTVGEYDDEGLVMALVRLAVNAKLRGDLGSAGLEYFSGATVEAFADPIIDRIATTVRAMRDSQ